MANNRRSKSAVATLSKLSQSLKEHVRSNQDIAKIITAGLEQYFKGSTVSVFLIDPSSQQISFTYPDTGRWPIPDEERDWIIKRSKDQLIQQDRASADHLYLKDRSQSLYIDKLQLKLDQDAYGYSCEDGLYLFLISEDELCYGIVFVHSWSQKKRLIDNGHLQQHLDDIRPFLSDITQALDNLHIHNKIESLLSDKKELKLRIQKDEEDLKRRILELTVLYDTSNALGYSLDYRQILGLIMDALYKVLNFDVCAIFLTNFSPENEIFTRINKPVSESLLQSVQSNIISASLPFASGYIDVKNIKLSYENNFAEEGPGQAMVAEDEQMKSFANVPLIFKEEVIGMLNVCSTTKNAFARNEMTFLHTMANQLASHLGRIKLVKAYEKSKIGSLIQSMTEGLIMFDENHALEIINPRALELLDLDPVTSTGTDVLMKRLNEIGLRAHYKKAFKRKSTASNIDIMNSDRQLSVNISPVINAQQHRVGTAIVLRDFTELQLVNRIKTQRLEVISKVNDIITSIEDLDGLLTVLLDFILKIAVAEMGSIQLKRGKRFETILHSNFPDKIRRRYRFKSGQSISEHVIDTQKICYIEDYFHNPDVNPSVSILVDSYICIPIIVNKDVIGIMSIARKYGTVHQHFSQDDIETLATITTLSGSAIHTAVLYQETLKRQRLDQELRVANDIQNKLLPGKLPDIDRVTFGAVSVPAREIGGDYYDIFELDNGMVGIVLADIVGKGIPAGLFMAMLKSILHTHFLNIYSPLDAIERINSLLYKDPVINKFIPLFYIILDPSSMTITYCNAGHEPAILYHEGAFISLDTQGFPLGALAESEYEERQRQLDDGDILMLFTDGIVESRNISGTPFGQARLEAAIKRNKGAEPGELVDTVYSKLKSFLRKSPQQDDVTLVALKVDASHNQSNGETPLDTKRFRVSSAKKHIKKIRDEAEKIGISMGFSEKDVFNLKLAINEAHANVIEHAYLGKEEGEIIFQFFIFGDRLEIVIKDFGAGMGQKTTKGEEHLDELEGSGLGVFLIKTLMDSVDYKKTSKVGTELILVKYLKRRA